MLEEFVADMDYHTAHLFTSGKFVKSRYEDHRWLDKKVDIQSVVFLAGSRLYTWYVESLPKTYNEGDRAFYDAIKDAQEN